MAAAFHSLRGRLRRRFGGVPVYIGHPDDPDFRHEPGHDDTRAYAWIENLEDRDDGIWAQPRWSAAGNELLSNAFYKYLSPRWVMRPSGDGFEPTRLISVGLTNHPNLPAETIANAQNETAANAGLLCQILRVLRRGAEEFCEDNAVDRVEDLMDRADELAARTQALQVELREREEEIEGLRQLAEDAEASRQGAETEAANALRERDAERSARIELVVANALREGRVTPGEQDAWRDRLIADFAEGSAALSNVAPALNTAPRTADLRPKAPGGAARAAFLDAVRDRMEATGEPFSEAWANVKRNRGDLFERLREAAGG